MVVTKVLRVDPLNPDENAIRFCCSEVRKGQIVVFPTETVYGLGAYVFDREAVRKIFLAKGRPADNPLIVHITNIEQLHEVAADVDETAYRIAERMWPGPLTIILRKRSDVPPEVCGGMPTVAVRMPAHPVALKLIECAGPIAAPSANISGKPSPTEPHHIYVDMFGRADIIIDAGDTFFGVESTIIDLTSDPPRLLRPGALPHEKVAEILGKEIVVSGVARGLAEGEIALAPGVKYKHYAPKTPLVLIESESYGNFDSYAKRFLDVVEDVCRRHRCGLIVSKEMFEYCKHVDVPKLVIGSRSNLFEVAKNLFKVLRDIDVIGVELGIVEGFPEIGIGLAIMNRLRKASGHKIVKV